MQINVTTVQACFVLLKITRFTRH